MDIFMLFNTCYPKNCVVDLVQVRDAISLVHANHVLNPEEEVVINAGKRFWGILFRGGSCDQAAGSVGPSIS